MVYVTKWFSLPHVKKKTSHRDARLSLPPPKAMLPVFFLLGVFFTLPSMPPLELTYPSFFAPVRQRCYLRLCCSLTQAAQGDGKAAMHRDPSYLKPLYRQYRALDIQLRCRGFDLGLLPRDHHTWHWHPADASLSPPHTRTLRAPHTRTLRTPTHTPTRAHTCTHTRAHTHAHNIHTYAYAHARAHPPLSVHVAALPTQ